MHDVISVLPAKFVPYSAYVQMKRLVGFRYADTVNIHMTLKEGTG